MKINYTFLSRNKIVPELPDIDCAICLDKITNDEIKINCGHCFHMECLKKAIAVKNKCPCCRSEISKLDCKINIQNKKSYVSQLFQLKKNMYLISSEFIKEHPLITITIGLPVFYVIGAVSVLDVTFQVLFELFLK